MEPWIPGFAARPRGGGTALLGDRAVFIVIVFVVTSGYAWRMLPRSFGGTAHRRFTDWTKVGLGGRIHRAVLDRAGEQGLVDWAVVDAASVRATKGDR
nr:transposase [Actinokineospora inagensis]